MIDMREPQNYHIQADQIDTAYSDIDRQANSGETEEVRAATETAVNLAKPRSPASPDDIDQKRNERRQDEMGRRLGTTVVETVAPQYDRAPLQQRAEISRHDVISQPETDVSIPAMLALCALLVSYRLQEVENHNSTMRNN